MASNGNSSSSGGISRWYLSPHELDALLAVLKEGDLMEFDEVAYKHWAVYVGEKARLCFFQLNIYACKLFAKRQGVRRPHRGPPHEPRRDLRLL